MTVALIVCGWFTLSALFLAFWCFGRGPRENRSREIARYLEQRDSHSETRWHRVSWDFTSLHALPFADKDQRNHG